MGVLSTIGGAPVPLAEETGGGVTGSSTAGSVVVSAATTGEVGLGMVAGVE